MSKYDDIINLPHHVSANRRRMNMCDRAAQFAPFAALTGHDAAIAETARLTNERIELSPDRQIELSAQLNEAILNKNRIAVTYFVPDAKKSGGMYKLAVGIVKRLDEIDNAVVFFEGQTINLADIFAIKFVEAQ